MDSKAIEQPQCKAPSIEQIHALEVAIARDLDCCSGEEFTRHHFCKGMYARQLFIPAGFVVVGKMHSKENFFMLVSGEISVLADGEIKTVRAPFMSVTRPGEKRVAFAHTDSITVNFHPNPDNEADIELLESRYIVPAAQEALVQENPEMIEHILQEASQ